MKIKMLICHFDLGHGGAEKVLVNLLRCLDFKKYDVTLYLLFRHGVNLRSIPSNVRVLYLFEKKPFRGVTVLLKLFSPKRLHKLLINDNYDIEIAYLEGAPTRIISGCPNANTKLYAWVHTQVGKAFFNPYRSLGEAKRAYHRFNKVLFVSEATKEVFLTKTCWDNVSCDVCHNVVNTNEIKVLSEEPVDIQLLPSTLKLCSVGKLTYQKGYPRLIRILGELKPNIPKDWQLYILGDGNQKQLIQHEILANSLENHVFLLGYHKNPYKYVSKMDIFICASFNEGYSTAVTESIVVGTPVITTNCPGMSEIFGDSDAGIIVENSDDALKNVLEKLLTDKIDIATLKVNARKRSNYFEESKVKEFEDAIKC